MPLTPEDRRKGTLLAGSKIGPAGRAARARHASNARWGKVKPKRSPLLPPLWLLLRWLDAGLDEYDDRPGWAMARGKLADVIAWVKQAKGD